MEQGAQDPVAALTQLREGWVAGQERQAAERTWQMEALRVQAGLQTQALLQLADRWGAPQNNPKRNQTFTRQK